MKRWKKLLFRAAQLQKTHLSYTAVSQLVHDILQAVEQEEKTRFLQQQGKPNRMYPAALRNIIHLFTEQNLNAMENYLRKSCELMLHDLEIPVLMNRWALRDFCGKRSENLERLVQEIEKFKEESENYVISSRFIRLKIKTLVGRIEQESEGNAFEFLYRSNDQKFTRKISDKLQELANQKNNWLFMTKDKNVSDTVFRYQTDQVIMHLNILKVILEIISAKTFEYDFSLS